MSYKKQELLNLREQLSSSAILVESVLLYLLVFCAVGVLEIKHGRLLELEWGWRHQNATKSCNYCIIELHIKQAFCI